VKYKVCFLGDTAFPPSSLHRKRENGKASVSLSAFFQFYFVFLKALR